MKTLSSYSDFLTNKGLYLDNQSFWNQVLAGLSHEFHEEWVSTKFANGDDFFDGNPIASALYTQISKAVRIIQVANDDNAPLVRAWLEKVDYNSKIVLELVVVVQPYDEAYHAAKNVLSFFLHETKEKSINAYIRAINLLHKQVASMKKAVSVIRTVNPDGTDDAILKSTISNIYRQTAGGKRKALKPQE